MRKLAIPSLLALVALGCSAVSPGHPLEEWVGRGMTRAADGFRSLGHVVDRSVRDVRDLATAVGEMPDATLRRADGVRHATEAFVASTTDSVTRFPSTTVAAVESAAGDGLQRLARLPSAPARLGIDPEARVTALRQTITRFPTILRLDRGWMPADASDPNRAVEIAPSGRPASWLERVTDRIRL